MRDIWRTILDADPAWMIGAWALLALGVLLLLWALFWDRPGWLGHPRERCPRCGYDMTGTAGEGPVTCPECGREHASRKPLRATRRRWGFVLVALVLFFGRYAAIHKDRIRAYGWHELIPTSVVVFWIDPERWYRLEFTSENYEHRWSDAVLERIWGRLDVSAGWERVVWIHRLGPTLDAFGPWAELRAGKPLEYSVRFEPGQYGGFAGWYPGGPRVDYEYDEALNGLMDLVVQGIELEDWVDYGGETQWWFTLGDRLIIRAPQSTLDQVRALFDELHSPIRMPQTIDDSLRFGDTWAVRLPLAELVEDTPSDTESSDNQHEIFDDWERIGQVRGAFMVLVDFEDWLDNGGELHMSIEWKDELWILSSKDIRQRVIDAAALIAEHGPDAFNDPDTDD